MDRHVRRVDLPRLSNLRKRPARSCCPVSSLWNGSGQTTLVVQRIEAECGSLKNRTLSDETGGGNFGRNCFAKLCRKWIAKMEIWRGRMAVMTIDSLLSDVYNNFRKPTKCNDKFLWQVIHKRPMEQHTLKNFNNCLNTNIYSYLETSGGQSSNACLNVVHFFNTRVD